MTDHIDFTEAELRRFAPKMAPFYVRGLLAGKDVLREAGILANGRRLSHFLGQFGAETGGGTILRESMTYTSVKRIRQVWPARARKESDAFLQTLVRNPVKLADWAYGGRMGNRKGTTDGYDYRGGGYIQTTGKYAVEQYCQLCAIPIRSDILDDAEATLRFACAEWQQSGCNELADANDLLGISKTINTGSATSGVYPNGMEHRQAWFAKAKGIWWDAEPVQQEQEQEAAPLVESQPVASLNSTSRKVKTANAGEATVLGGGLTLAGLVVFLKEGAEFVKTYGVELAVIAGFVLCVYFAAIKHFTRQDYADGAYTPSGERK